MRIPVTSSRPQSGSVSWFKHSTLEAIEIRFLVPLGHFRDDDTAVKYWQHWLELVLCRHGQYLGNRDRHKR